MVIRFHTNIYPCILHIVSWFLSIDTRSRSAKTTLTDQYVIRNAKTSHVRTRMLQMGRHIRPNLIYLIVTATWTMNISTRSLLTNMFICLYGTMCNFVQIWTKGSIVSRIYKLSDGVSFEHGLFTVRCFLFDRCIVTTDL